MASGGYNRRVFEPTEPTVQERVASHVRAIARRGEDDHVILADALHGYAWPDGGMDRSDREARQWFARYERRLPGNGPTPIPVTCGCHIGRCLVCN